jgi:hypothetical protein
MTIMTPRPPAGRGGALAEGRLAGRLIGLVFAAVVVAFLAGLFLL